MGISFFDEGGEKSQKLDTRFGQKTQAPKIFVEDLNENFKISPPLRLKKIYPYLFMTMTYPPKTPKQTQ